MAWCRQTKRHYLAQCWPSSLMPMATWGHTVLSVNTMKSEQNDWYFARCRHHFQISWWRHQMETFCTLQALCEGNSPVTGEFPSQRPVTRSFDVSLICALNKRLSLQSWGWLFETPSRSLWRHCNGVFSSKSIWILNEVCFQCHCGGKSSLVLVMAWCRLATTHRLNQWQHNVPIVVIQCVMFWSIYPG